MFNENEDNEKMKASQLYQGCDTQAVCGQAQAAGINPHYRPPTLQEQSEKNAAYHMEEAQKFASASAFLREYPQFDEFIRLVRAGAIQF